MAPNPVLAVYRLQHEVIVGGFTHKIRNYLEVVPSGDPSGYSAVVRSPFTSPGLDSVMEAVWTAFVPFWANTATFSVARLQKRTGTIWADVYLKTTTTTPAAAYSNFLAWGVVIQMKDLLNRKAPVVLLEGEGGTLIRTASVGGLGGINRPLVDFYVGTGTPVSTDAYAWRQSRSLSFIHSFTSFVMDSNEFLRRKRGLK